MVMMFAFIQLEHRLAGLEIRSLQQSGLFELRQNPVNGGQSDIFIDGEQLAIDIFGTHMTLPASLENIKDLEPRQRRFQAGVLQICVSGMARDIENRWRSFIISVLLKSFRVRR